MFERLSLLIGDDNLDKIRNKTIVVVGIGGVGGYVATSLVRSGIENLIIIDYDIVDISNINRQIVAYHSTIGKKKIDVLEHILLDINPSVNIIKYDLFLDGGNIKETFDKYNIDYIVDACDFIPTKKAIIEYGLAKEIKLISCMGTGNRFDPAMLEITEIRKTNNDPLARVLRKWVKDNRINRKILVLCSKEVPKKTGKTIGSTSFVPATSGLMITSHIINDIIK